MKIRTIKSEGIAALSYFVSSGREAMVVDPRRDASIYKHFADEEGVEITHIFETHRNEDYVIGSLELKAMVPEARIGHSNQTNFRYGDNSLADGETFTIGKMSITCLQTPGHTDDSICYVVADRTVGPDPIVAFTGDTLFVNEVGRTDLVDLKKHEEMSRKLYNSLNQILLPLGDGVIIHPGHGAGSVCGKDIGDREFSTIGFEKANNAWLGMSEDVFVASKVRQRLTRALYFKHCEHLNTIGPPIIADLPEPQELDIESFSKMLEDDGHRALDIRPAAEFLKRHIPRSISIKLKIMGWLAGWALRPEQTFSIILSIDGDDLVLAKAMLHRIGYDNILGFLRNGVNQWSASGRETDSIEVLSLDEFGAKQTRREVVVIDVREPHEYDKERIEDSVSSPMTGFEEKAKDFMAAGPTVILCPVGNRSTTAASILKHKGVDDIAVSLDGLKAWKAFDYPLEID
ncbi:MAG: MBL fold metallo-hydrolase [Candidatus Thorarchaeota archaeon]|nr:MBL fold metallo-hydrolase [Candidatus Thorarchaeota archaeon]